MTEQVITREMQEEVALAVGFEYIRGLWFSPSGSRHDSWQGGLPDLTDLTNLFKWVVPKVHSKGYGIVFSDGESDGSWGYVWDLIGFLANERDIFGAFDGDAGHALFLACYKLLKEAEHGE